MANGIIIIDKPSGWTSMDVCAKLRGILHTKKVGHAGTLDPMATGVLPVFVGRATRAVEFAAEREKEYVAGLRLGVTTNTQDITGTVLAQAPVTVGRAEVEAALAAFRGEIQQVPPMWSAVKHKGRKLYELARRGQEVERAPRPITIYALDLVEQTGPADYTLRVLCSKGTYVRTLCHDLGQALGCGGTLSALRRTRSAGFGLADALTLEQVQAAPDPLALLRPVDGCFADRPALTLDDPALEQRIRNGCAVPTAAPDGVYRVYGPEQRFLSLSRAEQGTLTIIKSFFEV